MVFVHSRLRTVTSIVYLQEEKPPEKKEDEKKEEEKKEEPKKEEEKKEEDKKEEEKKEEEPKKEEPEPGEDSETPFRLHFSMQCYSIQTVLSVV